MSLKAHISLFSIRSLSHSPSVLAFSTATAAAAADDRLSVWSHSELRFSRRSSKGGALVISMAPGEWTVCPFLTAYSGAAVGALEEIKQELARVPSGPDKSLAGSAEVLRHVRGGTQRIQINVEHNVSYVYHAMFAYFDQGNIALKGFTKFFEESSDEKRDHAVSLIEYQNKRGGTMKLQSILMPLSEYDHPDKGDALHAMELALSL